MKVFHTVIFSFLAAASGAYAASSWSFEDATLSVQGKGGVGGAVKEK
jgi:oligosaccharyltransferase complex subunit delta (ribophorin II)